MHANMIDIALIQESKLTSRTRTPTIDGYSTLRADRSDAKFPGGGLLTFVNNNLAYKSHQPTRRGIVETQTVSIQQSARKWLHFNNIYVPPKGAADLSWIPISPNSIYAGDLNGHSSLWDEHQPPDPRGSTIEDWILEHDLTCVNSGLSTRTNRATGGQSTPDLTIAHSSISTKIKWAVSEDLGSDHLPIIFEIDNGNTRLVNNSPKPARWKSKNVDWDAFSAEVESHFPLDESLTVNEKVSAFNSILIQAANTHVGKTKPKRTNPWMTSKVRTAVKKRNRLRKEVSTKRVEWLSACQEVKEVTQEAKTEAWSNYLDTLESDPDASKTWKVIRSLEGTPDSLAPSEALRHNGKDLTTDAKKAEAFGKHYASVSRLTFSKEERARNRRSRQLTNAQGPDDFSCSPITMRELKRNIKRIRKNGAPGPDDIAPTFLKALGPLALSELLRIFNDSFSGATIPQIWRHAIIIPVLKSGKPASKISSFRPISLTSVVVKLLEKIIYDRLYYLAESKGWLTNLQAGFRKNRSTEDQILRFNQQISDGFQLKPAKRTVMVLLDYSKAFDQVWREELLLNLCDLGVPFIMIRWIKAFLQSRTAQAKVNGWIGRKFPLRQGVPQGAVLSPLLFLLFINDLPKVIPDHTDAALFADDGSLWSSDCDLNTANRNLQESVTAVEEWSTRKKLQLNADRGKSEATFFSPDPHEASWRPNIILLGSQLEYNKDPKFLGVYLDRTLSFREHTSRVSAKAGSRDRILAALGSKEWGWRKDHMKKVYLSMQRSVLDYAAPAWQPFLSTTQAARLDVAQNRSLRLVTGQHANSPVESMHLELGIDSYSTHSKKLTAISYEKALRLPSDHPRHETAVQQVSHRTTRSSWRQSATDTIADLSISHGTRVPFPSPFVAPWLGTSPNITFDQDKLHTSISDINERLSDFGQHVTIYTDGSCTDGLRLGGAAAVITTGSAYDPICSDISSSRGNAITCSYEEEKRAMSLALNWLAEHRSSISRAAILTDSLSLIQAMSNDSLDTQDLRDGFASTHIDLLLKFVPGHKDIPGNEMADKHAKAATKIPPSLENPGSEVTFGGAKSCIRAEIKDPPCTHEIVSATYSNISHKRDRELIKSRRDAVLLAQLRSGKCVKLANYKNLLDPSIPATCPLCEEADQDLKHWLLECPGTLRAKMELFEDAGNVTLGVLGSCPDKVVELARRTLSD